jgi:hypothetical protein
VGQRAVVEVGEDLLDDGVAAVLGLGLDEGEAAVGEHRVVAPDGEQFALAVTGVGGRVTLRTISRAVTWHFLALLVNAVNGTSVIWASEIDSPEASS